MFLKKLRGALPVLEALSHLAVVGGIVFVALEFVDQKASEREANSVRYLSIFYGDATAEARLRLQSYWLNQPMQLLSGRPGSAGVVEQLAYEQIFPAGGNPNATDLIRVVEQLDIIATCIKTNACDREIVENQLSSYVQNILCLYKRPLTELRVRFSIPDLGLIAERELTSGRPCESV